MRACVLLLLVACSNGSSSAPSPPPPPVRVEIVPLDAFVAPQPPAIFLHLEKLARSYHAPAAPRGDFDLVPYVDKNKWGFADRTVHVVIEPRYDRVEQFHDGRVKVQSGTHCGFIDTSGAEVVPLEFDRCRGFQHGHAAVEVHHTDDTAGWIVLDQTGHPLNHQFYALVDNLGNDGLIPVIATRVDERYELLGPDGQRRLGSYEGLSLINDGLITVAGKDRRWGAIDYKGTEVIPFTFDGLDGFVHGISIAEHDHKQGVIDHAGKIIVPFDYEVIEDDEKEFLVARAKRESPPSLVFDRAGHLLHTLPFDLAEGVAEGLAVFRQHDHYGFINLDGKVVLPAIYDWADGFDHGVAWVERNHRYGFIDHTGKPVVPLRYGSAFDYVYLGDEEVVMVRNAADGPGRELLFYIDLHGHEFMSADTRSWSAKQPLAP